MRVRLTDGTREIEISTAPGELHTLPDIEATALRLLHSLTPQTTPHPDDDAPRPPFGYTPPTPIDTPLDGISLSSDTERAEPYAEPGRDEDDYDDQHTERTQRA
ncbi:hypothetical protein [Streptomyces sp. NPDC014623]|uniref:hypothetical protein n=1 Tax=Streptomyces sp. NPDC014623 TaxID=3364875 RepID=UPI0036F8B068